MIASFKLHFVERRARVVLAGAAPGTPGVDLVGADAARALALAAPVLAWFEAREPGVVVRSLSWDARASRVLATLAADPKPRVLRVDGADAADIVAGAPRLLELLERLAREKLAARPGDL